MPCKWHCSASKLTTDLSGSHLSKQGLGRASGAPRAQLFSASTCRDPSVPPFALVYPQVVVPKLTENYGASRDPPEKQAPMCTVHSFPHNIDHCLTWARCVLLGM
eukprot:492137-Pelagomonas_calceolata.AAC.14